MRRIMRVQVLVATMSQNDFSKVKSMNISSDCIYANQANETSYKQQDFDFGTVKMVTTETRGVGINRNIALLYSEGDYLLFSDDDLVYVDGYQKIVEQAFEHCPKADGIIFNIVTVGFDYGRRKNIKVKRVRWYNSFNYGAVRLAVKRNSIKREGITFSTNFGGGTKYSAGEDTLFINSMLKKGLKLFTYPVVIATVDQTTSTWFKGYNEKFYYDKGALFSAISKFWAKPLCLQYLVRHREHKKNGISFFKAYKLMKQGIKGYEMLVAYNIDMFEKNRDSKK